MKFKDDLRRDLGVFVNVDEFGELAELDGVVIAAQIIHHTAEKSARLTESYAGLYGDFTEIYFMTEPYYREKKKIPRHGEWCLLNGRRYDVESSQEEHGICKMLLTAYRQNTLSPRPPR